MMAMNNIDIVNWNYFIKTTSSLATLELEL